MNISTYYDGLIAKADAELYSNASLESIELYEKTYFTFSKLAFRDYGLESYYDNNVFSTEGVGDAIKAFFKKIGEFFKWIWEQLKRFGRWIKSLFTREKAKEIDNKVQESKKNPKATPEDLKKIEDIKSESNKGEKQENSDSEQKTDSKPVSAEITKEIVDEVVNETVEKNDEKTVEKQETPKVNTAWDRIKKMYRNVLGYSLLSWTINEHVGNGPSKIFSETSIALNTLMYKILNEKGFVGKENNKAIDDLLSCSSIFLNFVKEFLDDVQQGKFYNVFHYKEAEKKYAQEIGQYNFNSTIGKEVYEKIKPEIIEKAIYQSLGGSKEFTVASHLEDLCLKTLRMISAENLKFEKIVKHSKEFAALAEMNALKSAANKGKFAYYKELKHYNDNHGGKTSVDLKTIWTIATGLHQKFIAQICKYCNLLYKIEILLTKYINGTVEEHKNYVLSIEKHNKVMARAYARLAKNNDDYQHNKK